MSAELHCHSLFSVDAYHTPESVVDAAHERGIKVMALTEHNHLGSLERARKRAIEHGMEYLNGVEIDGRWQDHTFHFIALGFDAENSGLHRLLAQNHQVYCRRFEVLSKGLQGLGHAVDRQRLEAAMVQRYPTHPAPILNQWFMRDRLVEWGVFADVESFEAALADVRRQVQRQALGSFAEFSRVRRVVHAAGGVLLLAHVARYCPGQPERQLVLIQRLLHQGMDGFELYHPDNIAEPHFDRLGSQAESSGCLISGGSDCHDFGRDWPHALGCSAVPLQVASDILEAVRRRRQQPKGWRRIFSFANPKAERA
jgi:3',5'-nucleoside bisphosphate phosphatase